MLLHAFLGGRQYVTLQLGYIKIHFFIDIWGVQMTFFDNFMQFNINTYSDFCDTASWLLKVARV